MSTAVLLASRCLQSKGEKKEKKVDPSKRKLTELERLAETVQRIDRATCVVPKGAFYLTATGDIVRNDSFKGEQQLSCSFALLLAVLLRSAHVPRAAVYTRRC